MTRPCSGTVQASQVFRSVSGHRVRCGRGPSGSWGGGAVIHSAAMVKSWARERAAFDRVNVQAYDGLLERCARLGLRGVKLIPHYQGYPEQGPLIDAACQWAHDRRQIILNHSWGPPEHMGRLLGAYPDACFIAGHTTTAYAELMKRHANLFVCSCPLLGPRDCEKTVAALGADRLLFGSDLQDLPIAWGLGPILFARIPAEEKRMILGGNLRKRLESHSR